MAETPSPHDRALKQTAEQLLEAIANLAFARNHVEAIKQDRSAIPEALFDAVQAHRQAEMTIQPLIDKYIEILVEAVQKQSKDETGLRTIGEPDGVSEP